MTDSLPLRMALVGCGRIAQKHLEALITLSSEIRLCALVDNDPTALDHMQSHPFIRAVQPQCFSDLETMLQHCTIDFVALCTPSGLHAQQTILCAEYGRHILCEKPMATTLADGQAMIAHCAQANVQLFVVKQNRFNPAIQALHHAIQLDRFGPLYLLTANVFWTRPQSYYDQAAWRGTWKLDGGALMNQACHYIDLIQWLLGPIQAVSAFTATLARQIEAEDTGIVHFRAATGALASLNVTMLTFPKNLEGSITLLGERGSVKIGGLALNEIDHWQFADQDENDAEIFQNNQDISSVYGNGHIIYYQKLLRALHGERTDLVDGLEAMKTLKLLIAAYRYAQQNSAQFLPLT